MFSTSAAKDQGDGEPSVEDKLPEPFSPPVAKEDARSQMVEKTQGSTTASVTASVSQSATTPKKSPLVSDEEKSLLHGPTTGSGFSDDVDGTNSVESSSCETGAQTSQLEVEACKAVQETALFVKSVRVSDVLARTPELIFLNLVTLEENTYCVELTHRGWRIRSDRADAANCDASLELYAKYFETIHALLDDVSPTYRDRFAVPPSEKSSKLQSEEDGQDSAGSGTVSQNGSGPHGSDSNDPSD
ncbi:hypothetical protein AAVH_06787 [Aphelenchoides avenae]|nr:hypothetical protein AAVH_06787 [Aphelenchus avenae]